MSCAVALSYFAFCTNSSAQIGELDKDLFFTPVTPCRIMDTREAGSLSGILQAQSTRSFLGSVTSSFAIQGGSATNCNVLEGVNTAAIVVNFTVVSPSTAGYITAFPANAAVPLAATMNFIAGDVKGNNATLKLNQTAGQFHFKIFSTSQTHLVADVVGYYARPIATALECYTTAPSTGAINIQIGTSNYSGTATAPACALGYEPYGTFCNMSSLIANLNMVVSNVCRANHFSSNTETVTATQRCCRVQGDRSEP